MTDRKPETAKALLSTRKGAAVLAAGILAAAVLLAVFFVTAEQYVSSFIPNCILREITGLRCVMCGGTRCVREMIRGNFAGAVYYNPYAVLLALAAAVWYIRLVVSVFGREYKPVRVSRIGLWAVLISMLAFWIVRNFAFYQNIFY